MQSSDFKQGIVAFFDILGFKHTTDYLLHVVCGLPLDSAVQDTIRPLKKKILLEVSRSLGIYKQKGIPPTDSELRMIEDYQKVRQLVEDSL